MLQKKSDPKNRKEKQKVGKSINEITRNDLYNYTYGYIITSM